MNGYQRKRVNEALEYKEYLNEYESRFINNMADKGEDYELSTNQNSLLNRISEKVGQI